jgi:hypothetical protein
MARCFYVLAIVAVVPCGCGPVQAPREAARSFQTKTYDTTGSLDAAFESSKADTQSRDTGKITLVNHMATAESVAARQIIYKANISLVVDSLGGMNDDIRKFVEQEHGFIAGYSEQRSFGDQRSATWQVRVPVASFQKVLDHVSDLGVPENTSVDSEDVSEEFVDLDARLKNKRRLETELLELLDKRDGELKDVIAVKQELSSVREEIERMEGRLRFLRDQVSLSTITISAREDRNYKPQQAPTFAARIVGAWDHSLLTLREAGENLVLALVALAPWAAVAGIVGIPLLLWIRRKFRLARGR